ncbi:ribosomal RNA small subunit methyltransferase I [Campylobacterota bacterium]|nr:ribosomal RNA small subunit methyltransferase I [Campylobacterota bacterium]
MLTFAPTPIGNIDDLSFRTLDRLAGAEVFLCEDTRVTKKLLAILKTRFDRRFFENPRFISIHSHNEDATIALLDASLFSRPCVFVSDAGMPCVSDPGAKLVQFCLQNGIEYEVLPGANAAITAYAASGCDQKFIFYGFLPHKKEARSAELSEILRLPFAAIFYESPHRIADFADLLALLDADRHIAAFKELTKLHENRFIGSAKEFAIALKNMNTKGEWTIVVFGASVRRGVEGLGEWLIDELLNLPAPTKPLSKILAKISGEKSAIWYERLQNAAKNRAK